MAFFTKHKDAISGTATILQALGVCLGMGLGVWTLYSGLQSLEAKQEDKTISLIQEFYQKVWPEITKASYAYTMPYSKEVKWPWNDGGFPSYDPEMETVPWVNDIAENGSAKPINELIIIVEGYFQVLNALIYLEKVNQEQACHAMHDEALTYAKVLTQQSLAKAAHASFTGQRTSNSFSFVFNCYQEHGSKFVTGPENRDYLRKRFGASASDTN